MNTEIKKRGTGTREWIVSGVGGYFEEVQRCAPFNHVYYRVPNDNGVGLRLNRFIGSVPRGNFEYNMPNRDYSKMVLEKINLFLENDLFNVEA